jgi:hypothetical protein
MMLTVASSIMSLRSSLQTLLSIGSLAAARPGQTPLRFTSNGTFQLAVFGDLHYGEAEDLVWGPQQDINSTRVMNTVLDYENQQLVVLNGDLITGENTYKANASHYVDQIVAPLVQRNAVWASTYGNHDSDFNLSRMDILKRGSVIFGSSHCCSLHADYVAVSQTSSSAHLGGFSAPFFR